MKIKTGDVERAAWDARVKPSKEEANSLLEYSQAFFDRLDALKQADLESLEATCYGHNQPNMIREDTEEPSLPLEKVLANAPDSDEFCFRVPRIIEE